jgi:putative tryptophan/tyrosine transport system substrate-binding protein
MGTRTARVVAASVKSTPLVVYSCDPFEHVTSLARPGGNLTGVTCMTTELSPKRLELLKEAVPKVSRVMLLHDPQAAPTALKLTEEAARVWASSCRWPRWKPPKTCCPSSR